MGNRFQKVIGTTFCAAMLCFCVLVTELKAQDAIEQFETVKDLPPVSQNLCPEPKAAMQETPDDLSKIQSDITRYTLCVQRAQLLQRLNELTVENIDTIDSAISEMAETSFPQIDMQEIQEMFSQNFSYTPPNPVTGSDNAQSNSILPNMMQRANEWKIKDISGNRNSLTAILMDENDEILRVKSGDTLPNKGGKIKNVGTTGVVVIKGKQNINLKWLN